MMYEKQFEKGKGYIFTSYHKPYTLLDSDHLVPVHSGRACIANKKDTEFNKQDHKWMIERTIGDDTGENISIRNNEFSEGTMLYWIWKNLPINDWEYVGVMQYRRQLILNDLFEKSKNNREKKVYRCVHLSKETADIPEKIGLTDSKIKEILSDYDVILPYPSDLEAMGIDSIYMDWVEKIPGVHISDLVILKEVMKKALPEVYPAFREYLKSPQKLMYQVMITKPVVFEKYCSWLFDLLFEADKQIDSSLYTINGKRTMGYLAEILYGFYFTFAEKTEKMKIKHCGVTYLE